MKTLTIAGSLLQPFGLPRDAQRCALIVRVAALPFSHNKCTALVAPAAGVNFSHEMEFIMFPQEFYILPEELFRL